MPTLLHEAIVMLFQERPQLAPELIREVLEQPLLQAAKVLGINRNALRKKIRALGIRFPR
ncbi:MAG: hypothetical protein ABI333_07670 [bacterium]